MSLTALQLSHRAYLLSPVWQQVRQRALEHHGATCASCGGYGNDVHHLTYVRTGGRELMSDLQVLCRDCHIAKHRVMDLTKQRTLKRRVKWMSATVAYRYLNNTQKRTLMDTFKLDEIRLYSQHDTNGVLMGMMGDMLGVRIKQLSPFLAQKLGKRKGGYNSYGGPKWRRIGSTW